MKQIKTFSLTFFSWTPVSKILLEGGCLDFIRILFKFRTQDFVDGPKEILHWGDRPFGKESGIRLQVPPSTRGVGGSLGNLGEVRGTLGAN